MQCIVSSCSIHKNLVGVWIWDQSQGLAFEKRLLYVILVLNTKASESNASGITCIQVLKAYLEEKIALLKYSKNES